MTTDDITIEDLADYAKSPRFQGRIKDAPLRSVIRNPACGDQVELSIDPQEGTINRIRFQSQGCLISQACAAMLCEGVTGKTIKQIKEASVSELLSFDVSILTAQRQRCASLAHELLIKMLDSLD